MLKLLRKKKAQSTVEYAVLIIIIIGALLSIQVYIKRGVQGRLKSAADDIGDQFSPGRTNAYTYMHTSSNSTETYTAGEQASNLRAPEKTTLISNMTVLNMTAEYWGAK
ncbi:MAG: hypothetical protein ABIJ41_03895 [Candidatus Omnitrophota bacterium]